MSNLDDHLRSKYSYDAVNADGVTYPTLRTFTAERPTGQDLFDVNGDPLVSYLQPNETFNVTLEYELVTMCTEWYVLWSNLFLPHLVSHGLLLMGEI